MEAMIDLGILAFLPFMTYRGYRRGGIVSICSFLTIFVAFIGAVFVANNLCDSVGRLVQPVVKEVITTTLEDTLKFEDVLLEPESTDATEEGGTKKEVISMSRALYLLEITLKEDRLQGFLDLAKSTVDYNSESVTEEISTVIGREIARVVVFIVSFLFIMTFWVLGTRAIKIVFKAPGLAQINGIVGAFFGFFMGLMLVYVFAWATRGGVVPWEEVERTVLYEYFANHTPLDLLAQVSDVELNL